MPWHLRGHVLTCPLLTPEFDNGFWPRIHSKNTETTDLPLSAILEDESRMMMSGDHKPWQRKNASDSTRKAMLRVQVIF
jgi:hypothetical protein